MSLKMIPFASFSSEMLCLSELRNALVPLVDCTDSRTLVVGGRVLMERKTTLSTSGHK